MNIVEALVLFFVIWFMVLFIVLPIGLRTQEEENDVVPGTHPGSPANFRLRRTLLLVSAISIVLFGIIGGIILSGVIDVTRLGWI